MESSKSYVMGMRTGAYWRMMLLGYGRFRNLEPGASPSFVQVVSLVMTWVALPLSGCGYWTWNSLLDTDIDTFMVKMTFQLGDRYARAAKMLPRSAAHESSRVPLLTYYAGKY